MSARHNLRDKMAELQQGAKSTAGSKTKSKFSDDRVVRVLLRTKRGEKKTKKRRKEKKRKKKGQKGKKTKTSRKESRGVSSSSNLFYYKIQ